ncbi:hypothetical protein [Micromonospora sp. NPDC005806]|uniref:hypothetical protein n=1 Tax=Micromonospora sp. NPDC005806 TaxID=3364234 RepID=UPI0036867A04
MSGVPPTHRGRAHAELLAGLEQAARDGFADATRPWDPRGAVTGTDPGQGVLDCVAAALDVVWGYQEAWAEESFIGTARLPDSAARLLELVGVRRRPALAATGLQQLRLKPGTTLTVPAGFAVAAPAVAGLPEAVYETERPLHADARLNQLQPLLTPQLPTVVLPPPGAALAVPTVLGSAGLADQLAARIDAAQRGAALARDAARARSDALQLAGLARFLDGAQPSCPDTFTALCDQLCRQAHALVEAEALAAAHPPEPLTEAQQLVLAALARLDASVPGALQKLEQALARQPGETDPAYAARLDALAVFLDALVEGLLAQARDDVVRLHGPRALTALDATAPIGAGTGFAGAAGAPPGPVFAPGSLGAAAPGTDRLYLLPGPAVPGGPVLTHAGLLRPGDVLVLADVDEPGGAGAPRRVTAREAVRVVRVDDQFAPLLGEHATHVVFAPPLTRRYDLARTAVLGNVAPVSHGRTVVRSVTGPGPWVLDGEEPAWLPDASAPEGRRPAVRLRVAGEEWRPVPEVAGLAGHERGFTVARDAAGRVVVRPGDATGGTPVPPGVPVELVVRVGGGAAGNRAAGAADLVRAPVPEVVGTTNLFALAGGTDAEDAAVAVRRATAGVQTLDRAITPEAVRALLLGHGLVTGARVRPDPAARRHLLVAVTGPGGRELDDAEHELLRTFLAPRVPPGLVVRTVNRRAVPVRAGLLLAMAPGADPLQLLADARERLGVAGTTGLLAPGRPALGAPVELSDLHRALAGTPGLAAVVVEALHRDGEPARRAERLALAPDEQACWAPDRDGVDGAALRWEEDRDR